MSTARRDAIPVEETEWTVPGEFETVFNREYQEHIGQAERDEREEVRETIGLPVEECVRHVDASEMMRNFCSLLFSHVVPTIRDIGLWGPQVRRAYANMGLLGFADFDARRRG